MRNEKDSFFKKGASVSFSSVRENQRQKVTVEKMDVIGEEKIGHLAPSQ
jgi:hypothetical protein